MHYINIVYNNIQVMFTIIRPPPDQLMELRYRIRNHDIYYWEGRDVHSMRSANTYSFLETTGETPDILLDITTQLQNEMFQATGRPHRISPRNRVMLCCGFVPIHLTTFCLCYLIQDYST